MLRNIITEKQFDEFLAESDLEGLGVAFEADLQSTIDLANGALGSANIFPDTTAGLAATTSGEYFSVPSAESSEYLILYKNNAGAALEVKRYPSSTLVSSIDGRVSEIEPIAQSVDSAFTTDETYVFAVVDALNRLGLGLRPDGTLFAKFREISFVGGEIDPSFSNTSGDIFALVDSSGRMAMRIASDGTLTAKVTSPEILNARGIRESLGDRLSTSINSYGLPIRYVWGEWFLRETRQRLRKLSLGESSQLVIASIGDSWTHNRDRWCGPAESILRTEYGDAGAGWVGFGTAGPSLPNGNVRWGGAVTYTGTWASNYATSVSPDLCDAYSSEVGAMLSYSVDASASAVKLFAAGGAGVVQYRFNSGAWTSVDLSALPAGINVVALSSVPAGSAVLDIQVVSGAPVLFGLDVQKSTNGIRWHKLAATGSRSQQWVSVDETNWKLGLTSLSPNLVTILHGTNDQSAYDPSSYKSYMQTLISRVRSALPLADILLVAPCENGRANSYSMSSYASALYELAYANNCALINLQYVFGEQFSEYASTSPRAWFNADLIHPEPLTGGRAIVDAVVRMLTKL